MHLDDYHQKSVAEMTEERDTRDDELVALVILKYS